MTLSRSLAVGAIAATVCLFLTSFSVHAQDIAFDGSANNTNTTAPTGENATTFFPGCSVEEYYADLLAVGPPSSWTKEMVTELLTKTHANVLPSTSVESGGDDIFAALTDLDRNPNRTDQVWLIYSNDAKPAVPAGTNEGWGVERIWPVERGAFRNTSAAFDVYNTRAEATSVLILKEGTGLLNTLPLFFGDCGTVENMENCTRPATIETPEDTAQDAKIWLPPVAHRGDVARSLFYTQARYQDELGFFLVDCPPFHEGEYGYLSPLLEWHNQDPVSDTEIARNTRACERWQGNRNPFIDFPELVELFYGTPDTIAEGTYLYSQCLDDMTDSPTATPNDCSLWLSPGDIYTFLVNSDDPQSMIFYTLRDIPASVGSLFVTDNAYNGRELLTDEGVIEFVIPSEGISAGLSFGYGQDNMPYIEQWKNATGNFSLDNATGDNLFLYCINADSRPHFISAFTYSGRFLNATEFSAADNTQNSTVLPDRVAQYGVALPFAPNYYFKESLAPRDGKLIPKAEQQQMLGNPANYNASDLPYGLPEETSGVSMLILSRASLIATIVVSTLAWIC